MFSTPLVFADNSFRIAELKLEQTNLQGEYTQHQQAIQNIEKRFLQVEAIIGELQKQDEEAKAKEEKVEDKK